MCLLSSPHEGLYGLEIPQNTELLLKVETEKAAFALQGSRAEPAPS